MFGRAASFENDHMSSRADHRTSVNTAISEVLGAEKDALSQIEACEERAGRIMREARKTVRAMVRRAQQRIGRLHTGCASRRRELVAEIEQGAATGTIRTAPDQREKDLLLAAVRSVARDLTEPQSSDAD